LVNRGSSLCAYAGILELGQIYIASSGGVLCAGLMAPVFLAVQGVGRRYAVHALDAGIHAALQWRMREQKITLGEMSQLVYCGD
jgi:hypothetical protein